MLPALAYGNGLVVDGAGSTVEVLDAGSENVLYQHTAGGALYAAPTKQGRGHK